MFEYYIYMYLRSTDLTPYYVGKGIGKRCHAQHGKVPVPKDRSRIIKCETNLSEIGALALERRYIEWYGRKDIGTGILLNLTEGGEGGSGYKHTEEAKAAIKASVTGRVCSETHKSNVSKSNKGKVFTEEHKANLRKGHKGRVVSESTKENLRKKRTPLTQATKDKISVARKAYWATVSATGASMAS